MKWQNVALFLAILSYLLAIAEHLLNLGILTWFYSIISKTNIFYLLIITGTAFLITYLVGIRRKPKGYFLSLGRTRRRPSSLSIYRPYIGNDFGVKWQVYPPERPSRDRQPWADGPYCPKCDRELEEETKGRIFKQLIWRCPLCDKEYPRPKGDVKDMVEKNFAAYLRKKGEL